MIVNMLSNLNHIYYNPNMIIKYISFELIIYVINLNIISFSKSFNEFDLMFLWNVLLV